MFPLTLLQHHSLFDNPYTIANGLYVGVYGGDNVF